MNKLTETLIFGIIMIIASFLTNYLTDFFNNRKIQFIPEYSMEMITGIFLSSSIVYLLLSDKYLNYKLNLRK
jgi:Na+/glutamate symporter